MLRFCVRYASSQTQAVPRKAFIRQLDAQLPYDLCSPKVKRRCSRLSSLYSQIYHGLLSNSKGDTNLIAIGSFGSGNVSSNSDLDLVLITHRDEKERQEFQHKFDENPNFRKKNMFGLKYMLAKMKLEAFVISSARVPIIKLTTADGIQVDIQYNSIPVVYSTNYNRVAFNADERVKMLSNWLKALLISQKRFGGLSGLFTSFHVANMAIFFAQSIGLLPNLMSECPQLSPQRSFASVMDDLDRQIPPLLPSSFTPSQSSPGELVVQMIDFFANVDFTQNIINVSNAQLTKEDTGGRLLLHVPFFDSPDGVCRVSNGGFLMNKVFRTASRFLQNEIRASV